MLTRSRSLHSSEHCGHARYNSRRITLIPMEQEVRSKGNVGGVGKRGMLYKCLYFRGMQCRMLEFRSDAWDDAR
jgi:hypothetical protein